MTYTEWLEKLKKAVLAAYPGDEDQAVSMQHVLDAMLGGMLVIPTTQLNSGDTIIFNTRRQIPPMQFNTFHRRLDEMFDDQRVLLFCETDGIDIAVLQRPQTHYVQQDVGIQLSLDELEEDATDSD